MTDIDIQSLTTSEVKEDEPATVDEARAELNNILENMRAIDAQLGQGPTDENGNFRYRIQGEYMAWRRRAVDARRHSERRYRFLKQWITDKGPGAGSSRESPFTDGLSTTSMARGLAQRVSGTEAIAVAAVDFVLDQNDINLKILTDIVSANFEKAGLRAA